MTDQSSDSGNAVVVKNEAAARYEIFVGGQRVGLADYVLRAESDPVVVVMTHTETSPAHQGRGLAAELVRFALDDIAAAGRRVRPSCSYVAEYIRRHPERASLVG